MDQLIIPTKLKVGYNERPDTYNGYLGFITYIKKDKIVQEKSWRDWIRKGESRRKHNMKNSYTPMPINDFSNDETDGFVINKRVGSYKTQFGMRDSYIRIFDPRGFEFEIDLPNILYIIKNNGVSKGGELQGKFVYAWSRGGGSVLLLPVDTVDYEKSKDFTDLTDVRFYKKDIKIGYTYQDLDKKQFTYLGDQVIYDTINTTLKMRSKRAITDYEITQKPKKYLIFKINDTDNFSIETDTKFIKIDNGLSSLNAELEMTNFINSTRIGKYAGFEFIDVDEKIIKDLKDNKYTILFKGSGDNYTSYYVGNTYKKWGLDWKKLNSSIENKYKINKDGYVVTIIKKYKASDRKGESFKEYKLDDEFLKANFKVGIIKYDIGKNFKIGYNETI